MIAVQSLPCFNQMETVMTNQPMSLNKTMDFVENKSASDSDGVSLLDQNSAFYFKHLIKKYKRQIGDVDGTVNVCSGGLQQYLIKQSNRREKQRLAREITGQEQSRFEQLPVC